MWSVGCTFVELCSLCEMCATTELLAISSPVLSELIQTTPFSGWCVVLDSWELGAHTYDGASSRSHPLAHDKNGWVRHLIQFNSIFLQYLRWSLQTSVVIPLSFAVILRLTVFLVFRWTSILLTNLNSPQKYSVDDCRSASDMEESWTGLKGLYEESIRAVRRLPRLRIWSCTMWIILKGFLLVFYKVCWSLNLQKAYSEECTQASFRHRV